MTGEGLQDCRKCVCVSVCVRVCGYMNMLCKKGGGACVCVCVRVSCMSGFTSVPLSL